MSDTLDTYNGTEIAIIGMGARFPGARNVEAFWENLRAGVESIRFLTKKELTESGADPARISHPNFVPACGDLEGFDLFDAPFFGFSPRDAAIMDPQHRVFMECCWEALEDAAYDPLTYQGAIGIFAGSGMPAYMMHNLITNRELIDSFGEFAVRHAGNDKDFLCTRVSYNLNLTGPSINIQTACSTSLVAVHMAIQSLLSGECEMALAGGITIQLPQARGHLYREGEITSPDGHCRAFDADANGTVFGSGGGVVILKPLAKALEDGDHIHAIIKGSAVNNDGSLKIGYMAPSVEGQAQVVAEALGVAGSHPEQISYIEAHGTGTSVGDPIEIAALSQAFGEQTTQTGFCRIGSVKPNIGHLDTAAGVASLIKVAMALQRGEIPPSLHYRAANPEIDFDQSPFRVNAELTPWVADGEPRRAGISSLGVGGTNAHVIVEEAPIQEKADGSRPYQVIVLSARTKESLEASTERLATHLKKHPEQPLADVAYTLQVGRHGFDKRRVIVCRDRDDAIATLEGKAPERLLTQVAGNADRSVAFMFPGQGAQYVNMGRELYETEPVFQGEVDRCAKILMPHLGFDLREVLYPDDAEAATERLTQTAIAQPAIFTVEYALARLWMSWGVEPEAMIGHSIGEYVAACLADVFTLEEALTLVAARGRLMQEIPAGAMVAVPLCKEKIEPLLEEGLSLAAVNGPALAVVSGTFEAVEKFVERLAGIGVEARRLHTSHAFHSAMMDPMLEEFAAAVRQAKPKAPQRRYISNVTGTWITNEDATDPDYWVRHLRNAVLFADGLATLLKDDGFVVLEVGPGRALSTFATQYVAAQGKAVTALPSLRHPKDERPDAAFLLTSLGQLWMAGVSIDWQAYHAPETRRRVSLPTYAFDHQRYWIDPSTPTTAAVAGLANDRDKAGNWFSLPTWNEALPPGAGEPGQDVGDCLVFSRPDGFAAALEQRLRGRLRDTSGEPVNVTTVLPGERFERIAEGVYSIQPARLADYQDLFQELKATGRFPSKIAHLWNIGPAADLDAQLDFSFRSLVLVAKALADHERPNSIDMVTLSDGMQRVASEPVPHPEKATLLGPCRVIPKELSNVSCRSVDIELPKPGSRREERLLDQLTSDFFEVGPGPVVAYRGGRRWVQTYTGFQPEDARQDATPLRQEGTYLITGGFGALGLALAEHLARNFKANLILVGRNGLPERQDWSAWLERHTQEDKTSQQIRKVVGLEELGAHVLVAAADVAKIDEMRPVLEEARNRFGPIHGVFHTAGVLDDGIIQLKSMESADAVLAPKVQGTLVLDSLLSGQDVDFIVLYSSASSILGPAGQVDYAAANAFLDSYAQHQAAKGDTQVVAINWGPWAEIGMASEAAAQERSRIPGSKEDDGEPIKHPFLDRRTSRSADEASYVGEFSTSLRWLLDEHRLKGGPAVIPGTGYLELACAALRNTADGDVIEIKDVMFLAPFMVADDETKSLQVKLKRRGEVFDFVVSSVAGDHAQGTIGYVTGAEGGTRSVSAIEEACSVREEVLAGDAEHDHLAFGPRWRNVQRVRYGTGEALAAIELPHEFAGDLEEMTLHPAILDMATGSAQSLVADGAGPDSFYVPFSYGKVRIYRPLPAKVFSHIRLQDRSGANQKSIVFDVTIIDQDGNVVAEVSKFSMRALPTSLPLATPGGEAYRNGSMPTQGLAEPKSVPQGILPQEALEALMQVLSRNLGPQIFIGSQHLDALMELALASGIQQQEDESADEATRHSRPSLSTEFVEPGTELEKGIAKVWKEVLGIQEVGIHDEFWELGGHSLLLAQMLLRLRDISPADLSLEDIFEAPTIAALSKRIEGSNGNGGKAAAAAISPISREAYRVKRQAVAISE